MQERGTGFASFNGYSRTENSIKLNFNPFELAKADESHVEIKMLLLGENYPNGQVVASARV